jgi:serine/threonine protein kinase
LSHQDLKPSSLMISNDLNQLRYIGYGLVADLSTWKKNFNMTSGAPYYRSPENIVATGQVSMDQMSNLTKATDIWALGLIIYYILTRKHAFQTDFQDSVQAINYTILGTEPDYQKLPPDFRNNVTFMKMLKGMLIKDPLQRMKIGEVEDLYEQAFRDISKS